MMRSKEVLENWYNTESTATKAYEYELHYRIIKKDLEILEILKRIDWLVYNNGDKNDFNWYIDINKSMKITEEEAEKIKGWLNDK